MAEADLLEVVDALGAAGRLAGRLDGGQQQGDQDGDDRDDDQELDQGETPSGASDALLQRVMGGGLREVMLRGRGELSPETRCEKAARTKTGARKASFTVDGPRLASTSWIVPRR